MLDAIGGLLGADHDELSRLALAAPSGADGLVLVPYFEGERTPNRPDATGALHGLRLANSTPAHLARAAVEGLLCGLADGLDAMSALGVQMNRVILDRRRRPVEAVRELAPAILGRPVVVPEPGEYVADGAARQAAWVLAGGDEPPAWQVGATERYEADPTPAVRARYAEVRELRPAAVNARAKDGCAVSAPAGSHTVRQHNRALVLQRSPTAPRQSRAQLALATGLTRATVSRARRRAARRAGCWPSSRPIAVRAGVRAARWSSTRTDRRAWASRSTSTTSRPACST